MTRRHWFRPLPPVALALAVTMGLAACSKRPPPAPAPAPGSAPKAAAPVPRPTTAALSAASEDAAILRPPPLAAADATDQALAEIARLEADANFTAARSKLRTLVDTLGGDPRQGQVRALADRLKEEQEQAADLDFALQSLATDNAQARDVARAKLLAAGNAGRLLLRKTFGESQDPRLLTEACKILREISDADAAPLVLAKLRAHPDEPLRSELVRALATLVKDHAKTKLNPGLLVELLAYAETVDNPVSARMLRAIAGNWEFGPLERAPLDALFQRLQSDSAFQKRYLASFFAIVCARVCDRKLAAFDALFTPGYDRGQALVEYVTEAGKAKDPALVAWAEQTAPLLALVDRRALTHGLLLHYAFNEPKTDDRYRDKRPTVWVRDTAQPKTILSALKGPLANARTTGVEGGGIAFAGAGVIELPAAPEFRKFTTGSYSCAAWIRPRGVPDGLRHDPWWIVVGKLDSDTGLRYHTGGVAAFVHRPQTGPAPTVTGKSELDDGRWHQVAGVVDVTQGRVTLYVDGRPDGEAGFTPGVAGDPAVGQAFGALGGNSSAANGHTFAGVLDEVRIYTRALSAQEVFDLYRSQAPTAAAAEPTPAADAQ